MRPSCKIRGDTDINIQDGAACRKILKRIPKKYQDLVLWACFSPLRIINSKATNYLLSYFFGHILKGSQKLPLWTSCHEDPNSY